MKFNTHEIIWMDHARKLMRGLRSGNLAAREKAAAALTERDRRQLRYVEDLLRNLMREMKFSVTVTPEDTIDGNDTDHAAEADGTATTCVT